MLFFCIREINLHICSKRNNVEHGIKNINSMYHTVETRKGESSVTFVLSNSILAAATKSYIYIYVLKILVTSNWFRYFLKVLFCFQVSHIQNTTLRKNIKIKYKFQDAFYRRKTLDLPAIS